MYNQVGTIFHAVEYIESHLDCDIGVAQIAESAGYSVFHFLRVFNRIVHHTPYDYLARRRLSEAARILTTGDRRITDIAQDFCFNNLESFSRAFKRMFGMSPGQWRDYQMDHPVMLMPPKTLADLKFIDRGFLQYPVIEDLDEITFYGLMTTLDEDPQIRQIQRRRIFLDLRKLSGGIPPSGCTTITSYTNQNRGNPYYFIGVKNIDRPPFPALVGKTLPAGLYVKFPAVEKERELALNYLYFTWFPRMELKADGRTEIELFSIEGNEADIRTILIPVCRNRPDSSPAVESGSII